MRRFLLPVSILAVAIVATILGVRANDAADKTQTADEPTTIPRVVTPLLSASRIPEWLRQPETDEALATAVANVLNIADPVIPDRSCLTIHRDGTEVENINPGVTVVPGELQRLITAAVALERIPADSTFTTDVALDPDPVPVDGVLESNLWLIGNGDPTLSTPDYIDRFGDDRASTDLNDLADGAVADLEERGVTTITGIVIGDDSRYDEERDYQTEVWDEDDNSLNAVGPLAALLLNDGFESWPETLDQAANERAPDPATEAASRFAELLAVRGIIVEGGFGGADAPDERDVIATVNSDMLDAVVARALIDGTTSEMLLKEIGIRSGFAGARGVATLFGVTASLDRLEITLPPEGVLIADGSGLSDRNLISCSVLARIIDHPDVGSSIVAAMPAIETTSLAACQPPGTASFRVMASAEEDHTSMAGVFTSSNGDRITFVMMGSGPADLGSSLGPCNAFQRTLLDIVAQHPHGPGLDAVEPQSAITG